MSASLPAQPAREAAAHAAAAGCPHTQPAAAAAAAADCLRAAKESGAGLVVLTGAGMSVMSGVPVFRHADGTMSAEFLAFLGAYNAARRAHGLAEADGWFQFSVAEMFRPETAAQAWSYWRWQIMRALQVEPAEDYRSLGRLANFFGEDKVFVRTSNCDMLHERAGLPRASRCHEIHGSLGRLQCSDHCSAELYPVDEPFLQRLRAEPDWVPTCPCCKKALRPNVMIFADSKLEHSHIQQQEAAFDAFTRLLHCAVRAGRATAAATGRCHRSRRSGGGGVSGADSS
jgi:NAD-dependent SIR2 family protein deacetylase